MSNNPERDAEILEFINKFGNLVSTDIVLNHVADVHSLSQSQAYWVVVDMYRRGLIDVNNGVIQRTKVRAE